jgi:hypothetical protein
MSNTVYLSDVQLLNLSVLMTVQASVRRDRVAACYRFNLSAEQACRVESLGQEQLQMIVANRGHESVFNLRDDFWRLIDVPAGLHAPLSTVRLPEAQSTAGDPRPSHAEVVLPRPRGE